MNLIADFLNSGIRMTTPILFAAIASLISARAGILNLAIESKVLAGAFVGILAAAAFGNGWAGVAAAALTGAVLGLLMAVAHRIGVDLVVLAIGLNILVLQLTVYLMRSYLGGVGTYAPEIDRLPEVGIPLLSDLPFLDHLTARLNLLVYLSLATAIAVALYFRTRGGRHLLAVGEAPLSAAASGIPVARTQLLALVAAGAVAGIGGAFLSIGDVGLFTRNMSADRGWIGITAALLALNRPALVVPAAGIFGFASAASIRLQTLDVPSNLTQFLPQGAAFVALVLVGVHGRLRGNVARLWRASTTLSLRSRPAPSSPAPESSTKTPQEIP
ncbi:nucleoside ABC transporter membrane protein [Actinocorallia herbida]|uniref:Nucleoside ABC transporter membrane protein n=1 Tax=Actinocorallia herbida TaxID=58109 RepID=A0A3N1CUQ1_9ACTN|nr:ABC transporter permease [Actinocorallia herbida]ROO84428.1 nucleoside ABC transporter membrane protein [Actinocorallia herbida]